MTAIDPAGVPTARTAWRAVVPAHPVALSDRRPVRRDRRSGRPRRRLRDRGARQPAHPRRDRRAAAGAARRACQRRRLDADHGGLHAPESRGLALFRRQLRRLLRGARAGDRDRRGELSPCRLPAPHRRGGDRRRPAPDYRQRRGRSARPVGAGRCGRRRLRRGAAPRRLRSPGRCSAGPCAPRAATASAIRACATSRRRMRRDLPAEGAAPCQGGALHIALHWDGTRITHWYEKQEPRAVRR